MPRGLPSPTCVRSSVTSTSKNSKHIWVSDDLLADTFQNFTHRHRRYGSNIPGPLEARRRAAKRKNTSLAYAGSGASAIDPVFVFGAAGSQNGWWQTSSPSPSKSASKLFPSWLFDTPDPPPHPSIETSTRERDQVSALPDEKESRDLRYSEALTQRLLLCSKLKSIRDVIKSMHLNLRQFPHLAEVAFRQVLRIHWTRSSAGSTILQDFLCDPELNPPGSQNSLVLLQDVSNRSVSRKSWETCIYPAVQHAIQLGLVDIEELHQIVLLLPSIRDGERLVSDYHRLLSSLESSGVLKLKDLRTDFGLEWYRRIASDVASDNVITLLWRLRQFSSTTELDVAVQLITKKMQRLSQENAPVTEKFRTWVISLPQETRGPAILKVSQILVSSVIRGIASTAEIERWYDTISQLNDKTCCHVAIEKGVWTEAVSDFREMTSEQSLLVLAWTVICLTPEHSASTRMLASFDFKLRFRDTFTNLQDKFTTTPLTQIVMTLDTLPLPAKDRLCVQLQIFAGRDLTALLGHHLFTHELKSLAEQDLTGLKDERFYRWAKQNSNDALAHLSECVTSDLTEFRTMAQGLIMRNKMTIRIINRILEHSLSVKFALSLWPNHVSMQKGNSAETAKTNSAEIIELIHDLAIAFALSPVISPRSAFRSVYRLYLYLHRYGAPIYPTMTRALWHAGVTRYGKEGTPNAQLSWCLHMVRTIEGSDVADMLLWSAGFRRMRCREMEKQDVTKIKQPRLPHALGDGFDLQKAYRKVARDRARSISKDRHVSRETHNEDSTNKPRDVEV